MLFTFGAVLTQTIRFALQKRLVLQNISNTGATFARFLFAPVLAGAGVVGYAVLNELQWPVTNTLFWSFAIWGAVAQILATVCMVALFSERNFAVGITFKKTEVLMSVGVGVIALGEGVSRFGFLAILIGFVGILLLSDTPETSGPFWRRVVNRAAGYGLASGVLFAMSGVGYRGAILALGAGDPFLGALVTLFWVTSLQWFAMAVWLRLLEPGELTRVGERWRTTGLVSLSSVVCSVCWFSAFALQTVAYVNALGQVELIFSLLAGWLFFSERVSRREWQGIGLLSASVFLLILVV